MKIITIPHPRLRETAKPVEKVDKKLKKFVSELEETLSHTRNPQGVGLAATQVNSLQRIFTTYLDKQHLTFINPEIVRSSEELVLGPKKKEPYLEGCLSIVGIYGPVPRYEWVEVRYQELIDDELVTKQETFDDYFARVIQHELDHLNGVLFIDYTLKHDLPLYQENKKTKKMEEIDPSIFQYV